MLTIIVAIVNRAQRVWVTVIMMTSARGHSFVRIVQQVARQALIVVGKSRTIPMKVFVLLRNPA